MSLPEKPSELIRLALADLAKAEAMPEVYGIDMGDWHHYYRDQRICEVCLAGAVMAFSLDARVGQTLTPVDFPEPDFSRLCAINDLRSGDVYAALTALDLYDVYSDKWDARVPIATYRGDPTQFRADMEALASALEGDGL